MSETKYRYALALVRVIDRHLKYGTHHYRHQSGRLLRSLDEVIVAILQGELVSGA